MRRRIRTEFGWQSSSSNWVQTNQVLYVYDGNLVIQERDINNLPTTTYTRGKDLSGSLEGAGGIGGLLSRTAQSYVDAPLAGHSFYHADGNGNITMLINWQQAIVAKYLYDAFGNVLSASGLLANANLYRFSSKEKHLNSGLDYYLYRYYDPNLQRWPNRDPLGEIAFQPLWQNQHRLMNDEQNLYEFVMNSPTYRVDPDGRFAWVPACCIACGAFAAWDLYDAIRDNTCAGYTGADFGECLLQKALSTQGLGDLSSCVVSAIIGGVEGSTTPSQTADKVGDCFKCAGMKPYRDLGKLVSCGCCLGGVLSKIPLPAPAPAPVTP
jgi:RHS repeat-associated protein